MSIEVAFRFLCRCVFARSRTSKNHFNSMKMHRLIPRTLYYYKKSINTATKVNHSLSLEYGLYFHVPKGIVRKMIFRVPKIRSAKGSYYPKFG